jgi:hypothetical protein
LYIYIYIHIWYVPMILYEIIFYTTYKDSNSKDCTLLKIAIIKTAPPANIY